MPLDIRALETTVLRDPEVQRVLVKQVRPIIKLDFEEKKKAFLEAFDEDDVTQEIEEGPEAFSRQPELANTGGNLFSLLGFNKEQKPIEALREYLTDNVVLYKTGAGKVVGDRVVFQTQVIAPTEGEIDQAMAANPDTKLEWTKRSFTSLIGRGISGLPQYLFDLTRDFSHIPSRSGPAIQIKHNIRPNNLGPIPYLKSILKDLSVRLSPRQ